MHESNVTLLLVSFSTSAEEMNVWFIWIRWGLDSKQRIPFVLLGKMQHRLFTMNKFSFLIKISGGRSLVALLSLSYRILIERKSGKKQDWSTWTFEKATVRQRCAISGHLINRVEEVTKLPPKTSEIIVEGKLNCIR